MSVSQIRVVTEFVFSHRLLHFMHMVQRCLRVYEKQLLEVYGGSR